MQDLEKFFISIIDDINKLQKSMQNLEGKLQEIHPICFSLSLRLKMTKANFPENKCEIIEFLARLRQGDKDIQEILEQAK